MLQRFRNLRLLPIHHRRCIHTETSEDITANDREFADMKLEDFRTLYEGDERSREKIETILNEYEFNKYNSLGKVPTKLEIKDMRLLLEEGVSPMHRLKLINYLFKREMAKRAGELRKLRDKEATRARREGKLKEFAERGSPRTGLLDDNGNIVYGLWHNNLFCRIPESRLKGGGASSRLVASAMFGRKLVFDFGFDEYMVNYTIRNSIDQVQESYGINRFFYKDPLDLWFCNFNKNSYSGQYCAKNAIQNLYDGSMITVKEDCFTNHFDKSRLVYLSPNAREPLGQIHKSDDVYIVGVFNDKGNQQPVSYRKAIKLGIRTKCLPLDSHIVWQGPSKSLCINHVVGILLEALSNGSDWGAAFNKYIPKRKIKPMEQVIEEEERRAARFKSRRKSSTFNIREDFDL